MIFHPKFVRIPDKAIFMGQSKLPGRPEGVIGRYDAGVAVKDLKSVIEKAPECFEGEDLSVARDLVGRLEVFSSSRDSIMGMSDADERVIKRAGSCLTAMARSGEVPVPTASAEETILGVKKEYFLYGAAGLLAVGLVALVVARTR